MVYDGTKSNSNHLFVSDGYVMNNDNGKVTEFFLALTSDEVNINRENYDHFIGSGYIILMSLIVPGEHESLPEGSFMSEDESFVGVNWMEFVQMIDNEFSFIGTEDEVSVTIKKSGAVYTVNLKGTINVGGPNEEDSKPLEYRFKGSAKHFTPAL